jgi:hypothetical protein
VGTSVQIILDADIRTVSLNKPFVVTELKSGQIVDGALSYDSTTKMVTFNPVSPLNFSTEYLVSCPGDLATTGTNYYETTDHTFQFTTSPAPAVPVRLVVEREHQSSGAVLLSYLPQGEPAASLRYCDV